MNYHRKALLFIFFLQLIGVFRMYAANDTSKVVFKLKGFIKSDLIVDSRQTVSAREGFVVLYPTKPDYDVNGLDKNASVQFNQFATSSRIIFDFSNQKNINTKIKAYIESDFTGSSNLSYSGLRLRHAYFQLDYKKIQFLAGQYWHPLVAEDVFPDMISLNLGNPIKSAMRCPQIRFSFNFSESIKATLSATSQLDNSSIGSDGVSSMYLRKSGVPNLNAQIQYKNKLFVLGLMVDYKNLLFEKVDSILGMKKSSCPSSAYSIYGKFENEHFMFKTQIMYGGNLYDQAMMGGVANKLGYLNEFMPIQTASLWTNVYWKSARWNIGFFAGYCQNMGVNEKHGGLIYARGADVESVARFAPQIMYKASSKLLLFSETEWTQAKYGSIDPYAKVTNAKPTANFRENISLILLF